MIELQLLHTGQFLDIPDNLEITLNFRNPVFDPENIDRVWTLPFKLLTTAINKEAFGHAHRPDHLGKQIRYPADLIIDGIPFEQGTLLVTKSRKQYIEVVFQNQSLTLAERLKELRLRSLSIPIEVTTPFNVNLTLFAQRPNAPGIIKIALGINGQTFTAVWEDADQFFQEIENAFPGLIQQGDTGPAGIFLDVIWREDINSFELTLQPEVEEEPNTEYAYFEFSEYRDGEEADRILAAYDTYLESTPEKFKLPTVYAPLLYDEANNEYVGYANVYDAIEDKYLDVNFAALQQEEFDGWGTTLLPLPNLLAVTEAITAAVGLDSIGGILTNDPEIGNLIVWQNRPLDIVTQDVSIRVITGDGADFFGESEFRFYPGRWNLADYLPDLTGMDLFSMLVNSFAWCLKVVNNSLRVLPVKDVLDSPPWDITSVIDPDPNLKIDPKDGYLLTYDRPDDGLAVSGQLEDVAVGGKSEEYVTPIFSLYESIRKLGFGYNDGQEQYPPRNVLVPVTNEEGSSSYFAIDNDPRNALLFWRGFQLAGNGEEYPFASHGTRDLLGREIGKYSLDWTGNKGRFKTWYERLIAINQHGRTDRRAVDFGLQDLLKIRRWEQPRVSYYTETGTAVGVIESLRVKVRNVSRGLGKSEVTFRLEP